MSDFNKAIEFVLDIEKGFVNRPSDRGGPTNFGITLAILSQWRKAPVTADDVKNMPKNEALLIYKTWWWDAMKLDLVTDPVIATMLLDQAVNRGVPKVVRQLQLLLGVKTDGVIGKGTIAALNSSDQRLFALRFAKGCQISYVQACERDPVQFQFLEGWITRSQKYFDLLVAN